MYIRCAVLLASLLAWTAACGNSKQASAPPAPEPATQALEKTPEQRPTQASGPLVSDSTFELRADAKGPYTSDEASTFAITLTPRGKYHVNEEYPVRVDLQPAPGVSFPKPALERGDAKESTKALARFDVPFKATSGSHSITAKVSFAVCTEENCVPDERTLTVAVAVP